MPIYAPNPSPKFQILWRRSSATNLHILWVLRRKGSPCVWISHHQGTKSGKTIWRYPRYKSTFLNYPTQHIKQRSFTQTGFKPWHFSPAEHALCRRCCYWWRGCVFNGRRCYLPRVPLPGIPLPVCHLCRSLLIFWTQSSAFIDSFFCTNSSNHIRRVRLTTCSTRPYPLLRRN